MAHIKKPKEKAKTTYFDDIRMRYDPASSELEIALLGAVKKKNGKRTIKARMVLQKDHLSLSSEAFLLFDAFWSEARMAFRSFHAEGLSPGFRRSRTLDDNAPTRAVKAPRRVRGRRVGVTTRRALHKDSTDIPKKRGRPKGSKNKPKPGKE